MLTESKNPLVSIILPVYNSDKYLSECLDSIIRQTYQNLEILPVDDGSTDGSLAICKRYAERDKRIACLHQKHGGTSSARNKAIKMTKGAYILFIDSDDTVKPDFVEQMVNAIGDSGAEMAVCGYVARSRSCNKAIRPRYLPKDGGDFCDAMICKKGIRGYCCNKIYLSKIIKENNLVFDNCLGLIEDMHFNVRYAKYAKRFVTLSGALYIYRQRSDSATKTSSTKDVDKAIWKMKEITPGNTEFLDYILLSAKIQHGNKLNEEYNNLYRKYVKNAYIPISQRLKMALKYKFFCAYSFYEKIRKSREYN